MSLTTRRPKTNPFGTRSVTWVLLAAAVFGQVAPARSQVSYTWAVGNTGNWGTAGSWNPSGGPPGAADSATVSVAGTYTVTLNDTRSINNATLNNATATISHTAGVFTVGGTLSLLAGNYSLTGGTITGGSITSGGGKIVLGAANANQLTNTAVGAGVLDFSTGFGTVRFVGTTTLASGTTLALSGGFNGLAFEQTVTTNNLTINVTGSGNSVGVSAGNTLTFGSGSTFNQSSGSGTNTTLGQDFALGTNGTIQNAGLIENTGAGALTINPATFANLSGGNVQATAGTTQITPGGTINQSGGTFTVNGGSLTLSGTSWVNSGNIALSSGTLNMAGSFTTAGIGTITRTGGTANITGALNNASATLALSATTGTYVLNNGSITGGSVTAAGGAVLAIAGNNSANRLNNVTVGVNALDFSTAGGRVTLQGTTTIASGTTINLAGANTLAFFSNSGATYSLSNSAISITSGNALIAIDGNANLTIDAQSSITCASSTINTITPLSALNGLTNGTGTLTNNGTIQNNFVSSLLAVETPTFTNNGTIQVTNGILRVITTVNSFTTNFTNIDPGNTLTGGTYIVSAANSSIFSTMDFQGRSINTIATGTAVTLNGVNTTFNSLNALTSNNGTFTILGGRNFQPTGGSVANTGTLTVGLTAGDGSKITGAVTNSAGTLRGNGTITGAIALSGGTLAPGDATNTGTMTTNAQPVFSGGTLSVSLNSLSAFGQLSVNASGNLDLGASNPVSLTVTPYNGATDGQFPIITTTGGAAVNHFFGNFPADQMPVFTDTSTGTVYRLFYGSFPGQPGNVVIAPVPEPAWVLLACGAAAGFVGWRRRRAAQSSRAGRQ